jgi:hypothetical protein
MAEQNIDSSGRLVDPTLLTASDYLGYGTYSGTDIKVTVHYPGTEKARIELNYDRETTEQELKDEEAYLNKRRAAGADPSELQEIQNSIAAIESNLQSLDDQDKKIRDLPTSKQLAELQTLSWSIYRGKSPDRCFGSVYPKSYVRGQRTIGGSMVFTLFYKHVLHEILSLNLGLYSTGTSDADSYVETTNLIDQLPPLDISIVFANEYGALSHMGLWGVEFIQEGGTLSIEDIFSESVVQYVARDLDPIREVAKRELNSQGVTSHWQTTASDLLNNDSLKNHLKRRNPYI